MVTDIFDVLGGIHTIELGPPKLDRIEMRFLK